jgi:hypothetical protein
MHFALITLLAIASPRPVAGPASYRPKVEVWTNSGEVPYAAGQPVQVLFQTDQDAYVTVLRVDTDGRVRVLFPREPWEDNFARGGQTYEVQGTASSAGFRADVYPGQGYLFAVATADPFTYDPIESAERWDYELIADGGRIRGDPYAALTELAQRIVPTGSGDWDYDIAPYYVEQHYEYPRFLCYDCHTYASFRTWNPYEYSCVRFRIVVYDDPYYYPYRSYGGTRVVFRRPFRPEPRFIFKDRRGAEAFVTRVRERPVNGNRRRDVGVRGRDIGAPGTVPAPRAFERRGRPALPVQRGDWERRTPRERPYPERSLRPEQRGDPGSSARPDRSPRPDYPVRRDYPDRPIRRDRPARPEQPDRPVDRGRAVPREGWGRPDRARGNPSAPQRRPEDGGGPPARRGPTSERSRPREAPRAEPQRGGQRDNGRRSEPELRRRRS